MVEQDASPPAADPRALPWGLAWRIAGGQIVSWGVLYYAFTVVVGPMQTAMGWSRPFLNTGLSLGFLVWGACALPVGVWIQRQGGRGVMTLASLLGGLALAALGAFPQPSAYLAAWMVLGAAMAGLLYEPAFAVVTAHFGGAYRRGITLVTLVGGLASTVFIPLAQLAVDQLGWRAALMALGAFQIVVCVPLHALGLPRWLPPPSDARAPSPGVIGTRLAAWSAELRQDVSDRRFAGLAIWFTAHAAVFSGLIFQLPPILQSSAIETSTLLTAIALIGPTQVIGRLALAAWGENLDALRLGGWAMVGLFVAVFVLLTLPPTLPVLAGFATLYGASNGALTILRGTAVADLFGRQRYAELSGALALPAVIAKAASPLALAALWSASGSPQTVYIAALVVTAIGGWGIRLARGAASDRSFVKERAVGRLVSSAPGQNRPPTPR